MNLWSVLLWECQQDGSQPVEHLLARSLLGSIARRWALNETLNGLLPIQRAFSGRVPTTEQERFPYCSVIEGGSTPAGRGDKARYYRTSVSFHIWVDDAKLFDGEEIDNALVAAFADQCWEFRYGSVLDCIDHGTSSKNQINEPNLRAWEIVHVFTFVTEQKRTDPHTCCYDAGSAGPSESSSSSS